MEQSVLQEGMYSRIHGGRWIDHSLHDPANFHYGAGMQGASPEQNHQGSGLPS